MKEEWKDIEGYEGIYQVSNLGRVKSLARYKRKTDKIVTGTPNQQGYICVQLRKDNLRVSKMVHRLVMMAFQPCEAQDELLVNHKDLVVTNNRLDNLEWCDAKYNSSHYWNTANIDERKPTPQGEDHHLSKVAESMVREIRKLKETTTLSNYKIGAMFGIKEGTVRQIANKVTWKDVV